MPRFKPLFNDQGRSDQHGDNRYAHSQDAERNTDLHPVWHVIDHLPHGRRNQPRYNQSDAFFHPDTYKKQDTGREQHLGIIAARVKGQHQGAQNVHADSGPDPWHQGIMTFETEIKVDRRQAVMGGEIEILENLGKKHDQINDCGNDNDNPQFVKGLFLNFKGGGGMNDDQHYGYQRRTGRKS